MLCTLIKAEEPDGVKFQWQCKKFQAFIFVLELSSQLMEYNYKFCVCQNKLNLLISFALLIKKE